MLFYVKKNVQTSIELRLHSCSTGNPNILVTYMMPITNQDMNFQCHMLWFCVFNDNGDRWLFVLFILPFVELLTIL